MDLLYQLALTLVPHIGDVQAKTLIQHLGSATAVFREKSSQLEKIEGIGTVRARSIREFRDFHLAEKEMKYIEHTRIKPLFLTDRDYPQRLLHCYDSPTLLFYKGNTGLNLPKALAIVGTRNHTEYGRQFTEKLIRDLAQQHMLIVSGLAFGIDALAHKSAIRNNLPTIAVVAHGLDTIYPSEHTALARDMVAHGGGLLTEFFSGTKPDRHHFPLRNRIVAGMTDATVVLETDVNGGSMITAKLADGYNRDVFALPGRATDPLSRGCNHLIKYNKAMLLTSGGDLLEALGWTDKKKEKSKVQRELFIELSAEEKQIVQLLQEKETVHIDEINIRSGLSSSATAAAILNLEIRNVIAGLPGKIYRLV